MVERDNDKIRNLVVLGCVLALIGIGLCVYSLMHHLELKTAGATSFACNINSTFSCDDIANSKYAEDPWGNPLGIYGIGYFLGLFALLITSRVKASLRPDALQAYATMVIIGAVVSVTLLAISHFVIGKICVTCVGIYLVTFFQAAILAFTWKGIPRPWSFKQVSNGGWYGVMALAVSIGAFQLLHTRPPSADFTADVPKSGEELAQLREQIANLENQKAGPGVLDLLASQPSPAVKVDLSAYSGLGEDFRKGSADAKVQIVEFADYQCPACANASRALRAIANEYGDRVLIVFKNYPLDSTCNPGMNAKMHPFACTAARLTRCAGENGRFWPLADRIFDEQSNVNETNLTAWAKESGGLSDDQIKHCLESKDVLNKIQDDIRQANESGLQGTPTLYFNGRKYSGNVDPESLRRVIDALLAG